jgi:lipopolysaccharide transport system ATP-binding protein
MSSLAISAHGLGKRYRLGQVETGFRRLRRSLARDAGPGSMWAFQDLTFDVEEGSSLALIGRNGAGKSTLLKVLARITEPTAGYVDVAGRVAALLEVGTGFHPELTGRENVYLSGSIMGMTRRDVRRRFDEIVAFAGVEQHVDTPVKWYSSGMYVRLGFAVAAHLEPEILIVDEVLAVGDAEFQRRCLGRMDVAAREGRTVLFVSHNMQAVRRLCERAILLEKGHLTADGDVDTVVRRYLASVEDASDGLRRWAPEERPGDDFCRIVEVRTSEVDGEPASSFFSSKPIRVRLEFDLASVDHAFIAGFDLTTIDGVTLFRSYQTDLPEHEAPPLRVGRNALECEIPAGLLNAGRYVVNLRFSLHWVRWIAQTDNVLTFDVVSDHGESLFLNDQSRPGMIAPILPWHAVEPSGDEPGAGFAERSSRVGV